MSHFFISLPIDAVRSAIDVTKHVPNNTANVPYIHAVIVAKNGEEESPLRIFQMTAGSSKEHSTLERIAAFDANPLVIYFLFDAFHKGTYLGNAEDFSLKKLVELTQLAREGVTDAVEALGIEYLMSSSIPKPRNMGYTLLFASAREGLPYSQYFLALQHFNGNRSLGLSDQRALRYLLYAAQSDLPEAKRKLVDLLNVETGVIPETRFVVPYYTTLLGPDGKRKALLMLGEALFFGDRRVLQNQEKGLATLCWLAASGYDPAHTSLEKNFLSDAAIRDEEKERLLRNASEKRVRGAKYTLALYLAKKHKDGAAAEIKALKKNACHEGDRRADYERRSRELRFGFR